MDHNTLYSHILRDVNFISLIFTQKKVSQDDLTSIKSRVTELVDLSMSSSFKHIPHVSRELASTGIDEMERAWREVETVADYYEMQKNLIKMTQDFLTDLAKNEPKTRAA